jgi:hypothetical protein
MSSYCTIKTTNQKEWQIATNSFNGRNTPLRYLQMRGAFIVAFISKKIMGDNQKKFIPQLAIDTAVIFS